jgi:hypothetical protein
VTWRIHLMPMTPTGRNGSREPKYRSEFGSFLWQGPIDYGSMDACIIALDADATTHATLTAHSDVLTVPANLDGTPSAAAVTTTRTALDALQIPSAWVNTSRTWRTIVRVVIGMFILNQRFWVQRGNTIGNGQHSIFGGLSLDATVSQIPAGARADLDIVCASLALDTSAITGSTTIRAMLQNFGLQFANTPHLFDPTFTV